jgi:hypothetical protein
MNYTLDRSPLRTLFIGPLPSFHVAVRNDTIGSA